MAETINCPGCQTRLKMRPEFAGKKIKCPRCAQLIAVPANPAVMAAPKKAAAPPLPAAAKVIAAPPKVKATRPRDDEDDGVIAEPPKKGRAKSPCPECGEMVDVTATKCPYCKTPLEVEDEVEYAKWKKCPNCGQKMAKRVLWTFWGSFYFTAIFKHVRCDECGTTYNGKTGRSNLLPALMCVTVALLLIGGLVGFIIWMLIDKGRWPF